MISEIVILQSATPTPPTASPAFAMTITFNTDLKASPADIGSVVANWGKTPAFGNQVTGSCTGINTDGTLACTVTIPADQSVALNYFQLLITATDTSTDTDGLSLFSTTDFVATMRGRWAKQYQGLTFWDGLTKIFGYRMNQAHTAILQLQFMQALKRAVGAQLDAWGVRLGQAREALADDPYLDLLLTRIISLNGNATSEDLINIANLFGQPLGIQFKATGNAAFQMALVSPDPLTSHNDLLATLGAAKLAGVQMNVVEADSPIFTFDRLDANHAGFDTGKLAGPY